MLIPFSDRNRMLFERLWGGIGVKYKGCESEIGADLAINSM